MSLTKSIIQNISYWKERVDLAAAFRWAARFDLHEGVANHFSFSINDDGTKFFVSTGGIENQYFNTKPVESIKKTLSLIDLFNNFNKIPYNWIFVWIMSI